ncbi:MAG: hypothetical protein KA175_01595 [Flavobacteriales bacterium]|nr:hypothetical protein [Flavobacteriales bacterium]MBP6696280.1 hypothetical protein [Flavobacteriales bacterium]
MSLSPAPKHVLNSSLRPALFAAAVLFLTGPGPRAQEAPDTARFGVRPTFGAGIGMFAFLGDIGHGHKNYSPLLTRVGYEFRAGTPLTPWLDIGLYALHGRMGANERDLDRDLNFESRVTIGGVELVYNFHQLLNPQRVVEPYLSVGFESVEFLSKTDLYDSEGRTYNYWSDGTIRDIAEHAPNAGQAVQLQRDYSYESDIRELNLDGFGKYPERTWAVPIGLGARMHLGAHLDLRLGATLHLTGTDLIDGVTQDSQEGRQGNAAADRFLFSSFSINYGISTRKKPKKGIEEPTISTEEMDVLALQDDEDLDGVADWNDLCPGTPNGTPVDPTGCPLDGDGDGVPDHLDLELATAPGAQVDANGVTISDEDLLKAFLNYKDSGNVNTVTSRVESIGPRSGSANAARRRAYVVKVGTHVEGISEELIQKILSIPDVRTIEKGDTTFYVVGDYAALPEAVRRQLALGAKGIEGRVMAEENGELIAIDDAVNGVRNGLDGAMPTTTPDGAVVRVQLGAFRNKLSKDIFAGVKDLVVIQGDDGLTRYYTGSFTDVNAAAKHKVDMLLKGFKGAFLVAFKGGKRVSLREAGARLTGPEDLKSIPVGGIDKKQIRYRVQVGTFAGNVPMDVMDKFIEIGDVTPITSVDAVRYYHGSFATRAEADQAKEDLKTKGLVDVFTVGALSGRIIAADEADKILAEP